MRSKFLTGRRESWQVSQILLIQSDMPYKINVLSFPCPLYLSCCKASNVEFLFQDKWREAAVRANLDHVDKRKLKQMPNESQPSNITTTSPITHGGVKVHVLSTVPTTAVVNDKNKGLSKHTSADLHKKEPYTGHHVQNNPTWKTFPWKKDVSFLIITLAILHVA